MAYKTGWLKKVINGVSTKIFSFAHVKTVYTDYENGKLLSDKLTEVDDDIAELNSNLVTKQPFDKLHGYLINVENKLYYDGNTESIIFKVKKGSKYTLTTNGDRNTVGFSANYPNLNDHLSNTRGTYEVIAPIDGYCIWYVNSTLNNTISCSVETNNVGGVASEIVNVNESLGTLGKCKNMLNPTLQTTTQGVVTCTNNGDGTYTLNGTADENRYFFIQGITDLAKRTTNKDYKLVGCPANSANSKYDLRYEINGSYLNGGGIDYGEGVIIKNDKINSTYIFGAYVIIMIAAG